MSPRTASGFDPTPAPTQDAGDPDLILTVMQETLADGRKALKFFAKAREPKLNLYFARFESEPFHGEPHEHFRELFRDIAKIPRGCSEDWLAGRGAQLFAELLPEPLQRRLCALVGSVRTVQILSNETWIPWELLKLQDPDGPSSGPFLVEAFSVTRWLTDLRFPQVKHLPMQRIALVVPQDSGLPKSVVEAEQVKAFGSTEREVVEVPATFRQVRDAFASGNYDGWHFAGHGVAGRTGSSLFLENGEELSPAVLYGSAYQLGGRRPLVFLNACHSGRGEPSLTSIQGLAGAFLKAGAGAFIGAHWEVSDEQASCFAAELYRHLFSGLEIGEAVRKTRLVLRNKFPDGNAWLAYTVFADPGARCFPAPVAQTPKTARKRRPYKQVVEVVGAIPPAVAKPARELSCVVIELPSLEPKEFEDPRPGEDRVNEKDGTVLVYVPGGEFTLGAEGINPWSVPLRRVRLNPFWIGKFLVTNEKYSWFLKENPACRKPAFWEDLTLNQPQHPVVGLSWEEAQAYCQWASLELPSEAQWEVAARGTDRRPYPWGRTLPTPLHANFSGTGATTPVGAYPAGAGPYGTLDQAGNVWEWCADPWASQAYRQIEDGEWDPVAKGETAVRSLRGGSWMNSAQDLHAANRERGTAKLRFNNQGFRAVKRSP
jgi:formylglycine-generating enzyme required for sulfatase activity